jgi:hypothetical protein
MRCFVADDSVNLSAGLWIAQVEKAVRVVTNDVDLVR